MASTAGSPRRGRSAVAGLSGGILAAIWGGVWYVAVASGRVQASSQGETASQAVFLGGLAVAAAAFFYLRANRLSVVDGTATDLHTALSSAAETAVSTSLRPARERA